MCGSEGVKYNEEQYNGERSSTHRALLVLGEMSEQRKDKNPSEKTLTFDSMLQVFQVGLEAEQQG